MESIWNKKPWWVSWLICSKWYIIAVNDIYKLDPAHFLSVPGLTWQACLKKTGVKLELLTENNMLLMVEKGIRGRMCQAIHRYAKANNK